MYIVIYREHNKLNLDTKYYGPFEDEGAAYDFLCTLPALGAYPGPAADDYENEGVKYIEELTSPTQGE